jgi:hypothetical protein
MARPEKQKSKKPKPTVPDTSNLDLELDEKAWDSFEKLIKNAAKMGHRPHDKDESKKSTRR